MAPNATPVESQLDDLVELVAAGPVDLGAYTQAELAVVTGEIPPVEEVEPDVLAEAVRSLAARGLLSRSPGSDTIDVFGDLGLVVGLEALESGTLEIRRGVDGPADEPWRWLISFFPRGLVGVDRVDALGLHRLSLVSVSGVIDELVKQILDGPARIPADGDAPIHVTADEVRRVAELAPSRWQLIYRSQRTDGTTLVVDALVLRVGETRVDVITADPGSDSYLRTAVDDDALRDFVRSITGVTG